MKAIAALTAQSNGCRACIFAFLLAISSLLTPPATAWNGTGHLLVALIAYEQLEPKERATIVRILKRHERFQEDFLDRMPDEIKSADALIRDKWIFMHAATWPDIVRSFGGDERKKYHHSTWHYINEPIFLDEEAEEFFSDGVPVNLNTRWRSRMRSANMNILQAIEKATARIDRRRTSKREKALYLCWLFHLVGDSHQPLHSTALFSVHLLPEGDRGGNLIHLSGHGRMHSYWDRRMGTSKRLSSLEGKVAGFAADADLVALGLAAASELDPETWIDESHEAAWEFAYTDPMIQQIAEQEAELAAAASTEDSDVDVEPVTVSSDYPDISKEVATERVVQAGHRLAALLSKIIR